MGRYRLEKHYVSPHWWEWDVIDTETNKPVSIGHASRSSAYAKIGELERASASTTHDG